MSFWHALLITHGIVPWYCNKVYSQVSMEKVGVNIYGLECCHIVIKYFDCKISYIFWEYDMISHVIITKPIYKLIISMVKWR